jgi:hypothetical protein
MPDIKLPEVKLPDIKLPEGMREMNTDDIVQAARDVKVPKIELPDIDLSKVDLPKPIAERLPGRRRPNPIVPLLGLFVIGAIVAALWWLFTSSATGPRMRSAVNDAKARVTGQRNDLVRYDDESDLGSLLGEENRTPVGTSTVGAGATSPSGTSDTGY